MAAHVDIEELNVLFERDASEFQTVIEKMPIGVGVYNKNAAPTACNTSAHELLGLSKSQFLGHSAMDPYWEIVHRDGRKFETYDFPIIDVITNYKPILGVIMGVARPGQKNQVWLEVNTHPILNTDGTIQRVFCTYKEINL